MESEPVTPLPPDDASVDAWLQRTGPLPPLPDAGFSQRVLASLPRPPHRTAPRLIVIALGALAGVGIVTWALQSEAPGDLGLPTSSTELISLVVRLSDPQIHAALAVTAAALVFAYWRNLRQQLGL